MSVKYKFQGTTSLAHGLARQPLSTIPAVRLAIVGTHPVVLNLISRAFTCKATPAQISASYTPDEESLARSLEDPAASTMRVLPRDSIAFMVRHIDGPAAARHTAHVFFFFFCAFFFLFCPVCAASGNTGNGGARAHAALCQARLVSDRPAVARGRRPVLMTKWAELMTRSSAVKPRCLCARPARQRTPIRRRRSRRAQPAPLAARPSRARELVEHCNTTPPDRPRNPRNIDRQRPAHMSSGLGASGASVASAAARRRPQAHELISC